MFASIDVKLEQLEEAAPVLKDLSIIIKLQVMSEFRDEVINGVRRLDKNKIFKKSTGALLGSIGGMLVGDKIVFYSSKRYFMAQEAGVKPHTMWYLLGKTIPLSKEGGAKPVFRKCTLKSLINGGWKHPGYGGKHFVGNVIESVKEKLPAIVEKIVFYHTGVDLF